MTKNIFTLALIALCANALADVKLPTSSYGTWQNKEERYTVSKSGISTVNVKGCKATYETKTISGAKLLNNIQAALEEAGEMEQLDGAYATEMMKAANLIVKNKKYTQLTGYHEKCAIDGAQSFIPLTSKVGLSIQSAPDDVYSIIYKK